MPHTPLPNRFPTSVLIVDDSLAMRRQLRSAFEKVGFQAEEASEGVEGLWRARKERYDVVVTDIHMPTMDGLKFIAELRRLDGYSNAPVYVVTSDCSPERMAEGKTLGISAWIVKPPNLSQLVDAIQKVTARSHLQTS